MSILVAHAYMKQSLHAQERNGAQRMQALQLLKLHGEKACLEMKQYSTVNKQSL